uniref:Uncharacterized protein n=1 Tax=Lepeophtheirus salmonis TaxID=72036 RepID=A0A0K2U523_LEPSM
MGFVSIHEEQRAWHHPKVRFLSEGIYFIVFSSSSQATSVLFLHVFPLLISLGHPRFLGLNSLRLLNLVKTKQPCAAFRPRLERYIAVEGGYMD